MGIALDACMAMLNSEGKNEGAPTASLGGAVAGRVGVHSIGRAAVKGGTPFHEWSVRCRSKAAEAGTEKYKKCCGGSPHCERVLLLHVRLAGWDVRDLEDVD